MEPKFGVQTAANRLREILLTFVLLTIHRKENGMRRSLSIIAALLIATVVPFVASRGVLADTSSWSSTSTLAEAPALVSATSAGAVDASTPLRLAVVLSLRNQS
ncbi:MAG: hypothetical protein ACRDFS_07440, partial [Chloroflexota bacterium]